jgi:mono/diheme cytochrome c family protein
MITEYIRGRPVILVMKIAALALPLVASLALFPSAAHAAVDFAKDVGPILQSRCVECHGPDKQKGKLRLDTREGLLKGGKDGEAVKAGAPADSEFYKRVILPKDNDDRMPPKGDSLTAPQIETLKAWITEGAKWPDGVVIAAAAPAPEAAPAAAAPVPAGPPKIVVPAPERPKDFKPAAAEAAATAALAKNGVEVRLVALDGPWHEVNLRLLGSAVTDQTIAPLKDLKSVVEVRLGTTKVTDAGLATLKSLPYLEVLGLELTGITDAGLAQLKGLNNLTYLNLYGTAVTDAGLENLKGLKHLAKLYLWQTKVTPAGVKKLAEALPGLDINTGVELPPPAATAPAMEKKEEPKK